MAKANQAAMDEKNELEHLKARNKELEQRILDLTSLLLLNRNKIAMLLSDLNAYYAATTAQPPPPTNGQQKG